MRPHARRSVMRAGAAGLLLTAVSRAQTPPRGDPALRVMTCDILQGGAEARNVGFDDASFGGSRFDELAAVIRFAQADVVGSSASIAVRTPTR